MRGIHKLKKLKEQAQKAVFHTLRLQEHLDSKAQEELSQAMGFDGQWDEHRRFQMDLITSGGLKPAHHFLEIGSGPLTLGGALITYLDANRYTGIDVRPSVNNLAFQQIGKLGLAEKNPRIITSENFGGTEIPHHKFDYIISFSVLFHLTDALVDALFARVGQTLDSVGKYWANINTDVDESRWLEFPFQKRPVAFYQELAGTHGLRVKNKGRLDALGLNVTGAERKNLLLEFSQSR